MNDSSKAKKVFGHLTSEVHVELCSNCGACIASCPVDSLELQEGRPSLTGRCTACGLCYSQCPQVVGHEEIQKDLFGEESASEIGTYKDVFEARSSASIESAQDGGLVTSLLVSLLQEGFIDGAVLMDRDSEWNPEPRVVTTAQGIRECAGSKFTPGPILTAAREAVEMYDLKDMAVVGTPCQVKALREMAMGDMAVRKITDNVKLIVGLFCRFSFSHEGLIEGLLGDRLGLDPSDVEKFRMGEEEFVVTPKDGENHEFEYDSLDDFTFTACRLCDDFTAEFSDISMGGIGSPDGWSSVIVRRDVGKEAFELGRSNSAFEVKDLDEAGLSRIKGLSSEKKERAEKSIEDYREEGKPLPPRIKDSD